MKAADRARALRGPRALVASIAALLSTAAHGDVDFEPSVALGVAHTDNLTLVSSNPESQTVYQLLPAFSLSQEGGRLVSDVNFRGEAYRYADRHDNESYQTFDARSQIALDPDNFFFELGASRDQTVRDPEQPIPRSNLSISNNRVDRDDFYAGPSFQYPFGADGTVRGGLRRTRTLYDEDESASFVASDVDVDTVSFGLDNYRRGRGLTWALSYDADKADYGVGVPWEYRRAGVQLGAWAGTGLRVFVTGGKESAWDTPNDPSLEDGFWELGLAKQAGENLSLEIAAGERTFGSSKRAALDYRFGRGRTSLSYTEEPTTERPDATSGLAVSDLLTDDWLTRPGAAQRFLLNRFDWSIGFDLRRTEITLGLYDESRKERQGLDGNPLEDESQSGGTFSIGWRLGARTQVTVRAEQARREFGTDRRHDLSYVSLGAGYELGPRTGLSLALTRTKEESEGGGFDEDYEADLVSMLLTRTF